MIERYCRAKMAGLGSIDPQSMEEIRSRVAIDVDRIAEIETVTRHDVIAFLTSLEEKVGPASRFIHLGCTSSDIVDTANALLLVEAGEIILAGYDELLATLKSFVEKYRGLICMGEPQAFTRNPPPIL